MIEKQPRIALLIDADNSPASKIDVILAELAKVGVTNIRRAYGNWKKDGLKGWEAVLHEYAIRPVQQFDYSKGKNATDMGMVIEAMDLLYTDQPEAFGIVSLGRRLHAAGHAPEGQGRAGLRLRRQEDAAALRQRLLALPVPGEPGPAGGRGRGRAPAKAPSRPREPKPRPPRAGNGVGNGDAAPTPAGHARR